MWSSVIEALETWETRGSHTRRRAAPLAVRHTPGIRRCIRGGRAVRVHLGTETNITCTPTTTLLLSCSRDVLLIRPRRCCTSPGERFSINVIIYDQLPRLGREVNEPVTEKRPTCNHYVFAKFICGQQYSRTNQEKTDRRTRRLILGFLTHLKQNKKKIRLSNVNDYFKCQLK